MPLRVHNDEVLHELVDSLRATGDVVEFVIGEETFELRIEDCRPRQSADARLDPALVERRPAGRTAGMR